MAKNTRLQEPNPADPARTYRAARSRGASLRPETSKAVRDVDGRAPMCSTPGKKSPAPSRLSITSVLIGCAIVHPTAALRPHRFSSVVKLDHLAAAAGQRGLGVCLHAMTRQPVR